MLEASQQPTQSDKPVKAFRPKTHDYIIVPHAKVGPKVVEGWAVVGEITRVVMEKPK
jgi:hypothetical protein